MSSQTSLSASSDSVNDDLKAPQPAIVRAPTHMLGSGVAPTFTINLPSFNFKSKTASESTSSLSSPPDVRAGTTEKTKDPLGSRFKVALPSVLVPLTFPGREKVCGVRRRKFLLILYGGLLVLLVALVVGLSVGLSVKKKREAEYKFIPLPGSAPSYTGSATYYAPGLGACGHDATESTPVIAVSHLLFDAARAQYPADALGMNGGVCGRKIRLYRVLRATDGPGTWVWDEMVKGGLEGKNATVEGVVGDRCPGCDATSLDLSPVLFRKIATESMGRVEVRWAWVD